MMSRILIVKCRSKMMGKKTRRGKDLRRGILLGIITRWRSGLRWMISSRYRRSLASSSWSWGISQTRGRVKMDKAYLLVQVQLKLSYKKTLEEILMILKKISLLESVILWLEEFQLCRIRFFSNSKLAKKELLNLILTTKSTISSRIEIIG